MKFISKYEAVWTCLLIIPMFVSSYISAITFVQLGLPLLGTEVIGISPSTTSNIILLFAIAGGIGVLLGGVILQKIVGKLEWKIGIGIIMSIISFGMMALIPLLNSTTDFLLWMISLGFILIINTPISYSLLQTYEQICTRAASHFIPLFTPTVADLAIAYVTLKYNPSAVLDNTRFPHGFTAENRQWLITCANPTIIDYLQANLHHADPLITEILLLQKKKLQNSPFFLI
ncbi:MAG: hypothetical protein K9W44_05585 [Candidatus Lokiarchaeota archaeon]|nr:hypothetical protein [Candidatus Harpocratesius repetitus]